MCVGGNSISSSSSMCRSDRTKEKEKRRGSPLGGLVSIQGFAFGPCPPRRLLGYAFRPSAPCRSMTPTNYDRISTGFRFLVVDLILRVGRAAQIDRVGGPNFKGRQAQRGRPLPNQRALADPHVRSRSHAGCACVHVCPRHHRIHAPHLNQSTGRTPDDKHGGFGRGGGGAGGGGRIPIQHGRGRRGQGQGARLHAHAHLGHLPLPTLVRFIGGAPVAIARCVCVKC